MGALSRRRTSKSRSPSGSRPQLIAGSEGPVRRIRVQRRERSRCRSRSREVRGRPRSREVRGRSRSRGAWRPERRRFNSAGKKIQRSSSSRSHSTDRSRRDRCGPSRQTLSGSSRSKSHSADRSRRRDRREKASRLAMALVSGLPKLKASRLVSRDQPGDDQTKKILFLASPQVTRSRRSWSDPEGDWSRELRAFSPERREEQAKRRAMAEEFIKAKEEQVEDEETEQQAQLQPVEASAVEQLRLKRVRRRKRKSLNVSRLDDTGACPSALENPSEKLNKSVPDHSLSNDEATDDDAPPNKLSQNLSDTQRKDSTLERELLASLNELLEQREQNASSSSGDSDLEIVHDNRVHPPEEVLRLLEELSASATGFDAGDYWIDGEWDLEGLREDVEQLQEEQHICLESQCRSQAQIETTSCSAEHDLCDSSARRSDSPDPEYPIFVRPEPVRLTSLEPQAIDSPSLPRHSFRRRRKPVPDIILAWNLKRLLNSSENEEQV